jgi:phage baseplate assembly protein W
MSYAYTDIDLELNKQKDGDIQVLTDLEAIKANITNIVKTLRGSRRMRPDFCYGPTDFLAEPMTQRTALSLSNAIVDSIRQYEDRIDLINVDTQGNLETGAYNITVSYKLKAFGAGVVYSLKFILKRL